MHNCPKCNYPLTVRSSRPASKEKEREVYLRCDKCGQTVKVSR